MRPEQIRKQIHESRMEAVPLIINLINQSLSNTRESKFEENGYEYVIARIEGKYIKEIMDEVKLSCISEGWKKVEVEEPFEERGEGWITNIKLYFN